MMTMATLQTKTIEIPIQGRTLKSGEYVVTVKNLGSPEVHLYWFLSQFDFESVVRVAKVKAINPLEYGEKSSVYPDFETAMNALERFM